MAKNSLASCERCGGQNSKSHSTTYPLTIGEKQLNIERVWVKECLDCNTMKPTKAGQEKIDRSVAAFMMLMFR
jgi:translation initiation factor 2 beta subunit (eIF-2beta)/eIF-5